VLAQLSTEERQAWIKEVCWLAQIVERYRGIKPKRELDRYTKKYVYVEDVLKLCDEAICKCPLILSREPHRANPPSPHTLHRWSRQYRQEGILTFFRHLPGEVDADDRRRAPISIDAARWVNSNWRSFKGLDIYTKPSRKRLSPETGPFRPSRDSTAPGSRFLRSSQLTSSKGRLLTFRNMPLTSPATSPTSKRYRCYAVITVSATCL
jgi:hypothetical protein